MARILKLGINGRPLCQSEMRGLARHTLELLKGLHELAPELEIFVYTYGKIADTHRRELPFVTFRESEPSIKILWDLWLLPMALRRDGVRVFHSTNNLGVPWDSTVYKVVTLHDDLTHRHRMTLKFRTIWNWLNYQVELWLLKKSQRFIAISNEAKKDILSSMALPPEKFTVIYNGVHLSLSPPQERKDFLLYVGGLEERKNIPYLVSALELYQRRTGTRIRLRMISSLRTASESLQTRLKSAAFDIDLRENVSEGELRKSYETCRALIFPSLLEGFGLPVVEAMQSGAPLFLSDLPVFREITQGNAFFFDPRDEESLIRLLLSTFQDSAKLHTYFEANRKRARDFGHQVMAQETLKLYDDASQRFRS